MLFSGQSGGGVPDLRGMEKILYAYANMLISVTEKDAENYEMFRKKLKLF